MKGHARQFPLRLPKSLREAAQHMAQRQGISLNHFIGAAIAEKVSRTKADIDGRPSDWHKFDADDTRTYPSLTDAPIEVRYANDKVVEGNGLLLFERGKEEIAAWRYLRDTQTP